MPGARKGAIAPSGRLASRCATLSARRANATYMASVCSDSALQPYLPQVLLLNQRLLGKEGPGHLGGSLFVWVQKSAWVNASTMRRWLSLLRKALQPRVGARTVLVFVDAAPPRLHASVWAHAKRCAVRLLLIPRGLKRLLQRQQMSRCFAQFRDRQLFHQSSCQLGLVGSAGLGCSCLLSLGWHIPFELPWILWIVGPY